MIARAGIDLHWLLTGEGEMLRADRPAPGIDPDVLAGVLEAIEARLNGRELRPDKMAALIALVYDSIASGAPCEPAVLERYIRLAA